MFTHNGGEIAERYKELLSEIPLACVTTADKIITLARERLPGKLHNIVYITLTDHIHFALQRHAEGLDIKNALLWEIKSSIRPSSPSAGGAGPDRPTAEYRVAGR